MLFNSYVFLLGFLPFALTSYFAVAHRWGARAAVGWLGLLSLGFYAYWNPPYVIIIVVSMLANYLLGHTLHDAAAHSARTPRHKLLLTFGVSMNLAVLAYFKYANFFIDVLGTLSGHQLIMAQVILPLGISFFTFEQVQYVVDAYRGRARDYSFLEYVFFVTFFPHLIAGPIIAHHELLAQVKDAARFRFNSQSFAVGVTLFIIGLSKKVILADTLAPYASAGFEAARHTPPTALAAWLAVLAYALQLYFDFSGYSDMGLGLARMLGFQLPLNFDSPYKASNIIDFWRRWHMTLSRFLRDYLYIPLGGNRAGEARRQLNLMLTMLLGGLWHGAGWGFIIWGGLHGLYLAINHSFVAWRARRGRPAEQDGWWAREAATLLTFVAVLVGWVFFRAADWQTSLRLLSGMAGGHGLGLGEALSTQRRAWALCLIVYALARLAPNSTGLLAPHAPALPPIRSQARYLWRPCARHAGVCGALACAALLSMTKVSEFLYFQF